MGNDSIVKYGISKVATMIICVIMRNALPGMSTFRVGMWMINCMPLIIPQIYAIHPETRIYKNALKALVAAVAICAPLATAATV